MATQAWKDHAYPLQLVTIELQGTRHSDKAAILAQLQEVVERIKQGDTKGETGQQQVKGGHRGQAQVFAS